MRSIILSLLMIFSLMLGITSGQNIAKDQPLHTILIKAAQASKNNLHSGTGEGVYKTYNRKSKDDPWVLKMDVNVKSVFQGDNFHITLTTDDKSKYQYTRRIIIYDGSALATSRFSKRIRPVEAEGELMDFDHHWLPDFRWDLARHSKLVIDIEKFIESRGIENIKLVKNKNGDIEGRVDSERYYTTFVAMEKYGYNVSEYKIWNEGVAHPATEITSTWAKDGDVWYVKSISETNDFQDHFSRCEFSYSQFSANVKVDDMQFDLAMLDLPDRARIIDRRASERNGKNRLRYVKGDQKDAAKPANSANPSSTMATQIAAVSTQRPIYRVKSSFPINPRSTKSYPVWLVVFLVPIVLLLLSAYMRRYRL
jgi:hypothetical protein